VNGDAGFERWEIDGQWKSRQCPRKLITQESRDWLQIFQTYKAGFLLVSGGILDQPAVYINAMTLIDTLISKATSK
jgi:hypothetical protein